MNFLDVLSHANAEDIHAIKNYVTKENIDENELSGLWNMFNSWLDSNLSSRNSHNNSFLQKMNTQQYLNLKDGFIELGFNELLISEMQHFLYQLAIKKNSISLMDLVFSQPNNIDVNAMIDEEVRWEVSDSGRDVKGNVSTWPLLAAIHNESFDVMFKLLDNGAKFTHDYRILSDVDCNHSRHPYVNFMSFRHSQDFTQIGNQWWVPLIYNPDAIISKFAQEIPKETFEAMKQADLTQEFIQQAKLHDMEHIMQEWQKDEFSSIIINSILGKRAIDSFYRFDSNNIQPLPLYPSQEMILAELFVTEGVSPVIRYIDKLAQYDLFPNPKQKEAILTLLIRHERNIDFIEDWDFSSHSAKALEQVMKKAVLHEKSWNKAGKIAHLQYSNYIHSHFDKDRCLAMEYVDNFTDNIDKRDNNCYPNHKHNVNDFAKRLNSLLNGVKKITELYPEFRLNEEDKKEIFESIQHYHDTYFSKLQQNIEKNALSSSEQVIFEKFNLSYLFDLQHMWKAADKNNNTQRL